MLRLAVVGIGWAGTRQIEAIRELGRDVEAVCLVDADADLLREKAAALGVPRTYPDLNAALAAPDVDAVSICLPHALHCAATLAAIDAGKHVLVEKPMATTVEEATSMIEAAEAADVTLYVAENVPYQPMSKLLREIVQSGEHIGELTAASLVAGFRAPNFGYPGRRAWLTRPDLGGTGTWMLHGIHTMAQLRFVLGEVETVYVREHRAASFRRPDIEGTMSGLLTLERGAHVSILQTSETRLPGNLSGYVLYGDRGTIRASAAGYEVFTDEAGASPPIRPYPAEPLSDYAQEILAFTDQVAGRADGPTAGRSERRSLAIVQAGYESAGHGRPVDLRERFGILA
jgi:predicted dehydrogenase